MDSETHDAARRTVHSALQEMVEEDEVIVGWGIVIDVVTIEGERYLAHRNGGGHEGDEPPTLWALAGMHESALDLARNQLSEGTFDATDDEDDPA